LAPYTSAAGFVELTHYYRPDGVPREQQPWLFIDGGADVVLRGDSTSERQSLVECKLKTMGAKIGASHSPLLRLAGRRGPRAFVRSDPGAKPEAFILAAQTR